MKAIFDCKLTKDNLKKLAAITTSDTVNIVVKDNVARLISSGNDRVIEIEVPVTAEGTVKFTVNQKMFSGIMEGRSSVTIETTDGDNNIVFHGTKKGSSYKGSIVLLPYNKIKIKTLEEGLIFKKEHHTALMEALPQVRLTDVYSNGIMYIFIKGTSKKLIVSCFDNSHVIYHTNKSVRFKRDINFSFPVQILEIIGSLAQGNPYSIAVDDSLILVKGKDFMANFPSMQTVSETDLNEVIKYILALPKKSESHITISIDKLKKFITNAASMYEANESLLLKAADDNKVALSIETSVGKLQETIKAEGKWKEDAHCNPLLLVDLIGSVPVKEIEINNFKGQAMYFRVTGAKTKTTYSCSFIQETAKPKKKKHE